MPVGAYFGGKGRKVMKDMQGRYGEKKGKSVFYATANAEDNREAKGGKKGKYARSKTKCPRCGGRVVKGVCQKCGWRERMGSPRE